MVQTILREIESSVVENEVVAEGRRLAIIHRPREAVGTAGPSGFGCTVAVVVVVESVLIEQTGSDRVEHHLRASSAAIVTRVLLVVSDRQILSCGHNPSCG
jgi:hypothetical protein